MDGKSGVSPHSPEQPEQLAALRRVMEMTGCSKTRIYGLINQGAFPAPLKLWGRSLWVVSEVQTWIRQQVRDRPRLQPRKHG